MPGKKAAVYRTCGTASKNASSGLPGRTRAGVSAVMYLLMINRPSVLLNGLKIFKSKKISKEVPSFVS